LHPKLDGNRNLGQQTDAMMEAHMAPNAGSPLAGLRVLDLATMYAGPLAAMLLGDFGADVIKIEHPRGDPLRTHGPSRNGHGLWWKVLGRNKRAVTLNLSTPDGQELLVGLAEHCDVLIENFRPGVMERWNLGYERLSERNPGLVMLRVTGFGQFGPYSASHISQANLTNLRLCRHSGLPMASVVSRARLALSWRFTTAMRVAAAGRLSTSPSSSPF
jgi:hypothetical protein